MVINGGVSVTVLPASVMFVDDGVFLFVSFYFLSKEFRHALVSAG